MALQAGEGYKGGFVRDSNYALLTATGAGTMQEGYLRDTDGRLIVQGGAATTATLSAPRLLLDGSGAASTSSVLATDYLINPVTVDTLANTTITAGGSRGIPRILYTGANFDFTGTTQKLYMESVVNVGTGTVGTITFSLCAFTVTANALTKGAAVLSSSALSLNVSSANVTEQTAQINKPANGVYMFTYNHSATLAGGIQFSCRLYVQNV